VNSNFMETFYAAHRQYGVIPRQLSPASSAVHRPGVGARHSRPEQTLHFLFAFFVLGVGPESLSILHRNLETCRGSIQEQEFCVRY
jgi:hypothetical protein